MDVLEQERMHEDLRPEVAVRDLIGRRRRGDNLPAARTPVPMMPEAGDFHSGGDEILLEVFTHVHRLPQGGSASGTVRELLVHYSVDVVRLGTSHPRVARFLAGTLGTPLEERGESVQARLLGRAKLFNETLDFVLEGGLFPLEFRDQRDQLSLREFPNFRAEVL